MHSLNAATRAMQKQMDKNIAELLDGLKCRRCGAQAARVCVEFMCNRLGHGHTHTYGLCAEHDAHSRDSA